MSIISNSSQTFFQRSLGQMSALREAIETLQTQIATGQKLQRASQDPAAAARLRAIARSEKLGDIEEYNATKLSQDLTSAATELAGVGEVIARARELASQAGNDTLGASGREAIAAELEQLSEELFTRANGQTLTGEPLFAGTAGGPAYIRAADGSVVYAGNSDAGSVPVAPDTAIERGVAGPQVFAFDVAGTPTTTFALISGLAAALRGGAADPGAIARDTLAGLDVALDAANRSQTVVGTRLAWIEVVQQNQFDRTIALAEERSLVGDTDVGNAIARLQQTLTALEATQTTFTRVSSLTLFNAL
ncbi:flagellar biosynthesis protein FlgL [Erythrobacter sp. JK5]|uniref:flagellin N-terminal helical domain-containing protein n=1 Tax=Erythrobacter sp. JK5 TaxID=2829500 RepID=UPI001BAB8B8F|nr:flagellar biosynthesis protein FlgL [Erythrobacter sp. JK5]QUL36919.1 flagellar biosynthesis protein FlgL [Erythrobacter sp. JK5]